MLTWALVALGAMAYMSIGYGLSKKGWDVADKWNKEGGPHPITKYLFFPISEIDKQGPVDSHNSLVYELGNENTYVIAHSFIWPFKHLLWVPFVSMGYWSYRLFAKTRTKRLLLASYFLLTAPARIPGAVKKIPGAVKRISGAVKKLLAKRAEKKTKLLEAAKIDSAPEIPNPVKDMTNDCDSLRRDVCSLEEQLTQKRRALNEAEAKLELNTISPNGRDPRLISNL